MSCSDASNAIREGIGTSRWRYRNKPSEASERNLGDIGIKRRGNGTYNRIILTFEINRGKACKSRKIVVTLQQKTRRKRGRRRPGADRTRKGQSLLCDDISPMLDGVGDFFLLYPRPSFKASEALCVHLVNSATAASV